MARSVDGDIIMGDDIVCYLPFDAHNAMLKFAHQRQRQCEAAACFSELMRRIGEDIEHGRLRLMNMPANMENYANYAPDIAEPAALLAHLKSAPPPVEGAVGCVSAKRRGKVHVTFLVNPLGSFYRDFLLALDAGENAEWSFRLQQRVVRASRHQQR